MISEICLDPIYGVHFPVNLSNVNVRSDWVLAKVQTVQKICTITMLNDNSPRNESRHICPRCKSGHF
jgi:hypothetical protein